RPAGAGGGAGVGRRLARPRRPGGGGCPGRGPDRPHLLRQQEGAAVAAVVRPAGRRGDQEAGGAGGLQARDAAGDGRGAARPDLAGRVGGGVMSALTTNLNAVWMSLDDLHPSRLDSVFYRGDYLENDRRLRQATCGTRTLGQIAPKMFKGAFYVLESE